MTRRDYLAVCPQGHRSFLSLDLLGRDYEEVTGRCSTCGEPARLTPLPPPR